MKELICFITHNFSKIFLNNLIKIDNSVNVDLYDVLVLFDSRHTYDESNIKFQNITVVKVDVIRTSYDDKGHTLYIHFFRKNKYILQNYKYIWIIENDVYHKDLLYFIYKHQCYEYDLLVSEYGLRDKIWPWTNTLRGFSKVISVGVLAVIMRMSNQMLINLLENLDVNYSGYLEAILPHICINYKFTLHQFLPELLGVLTVDNSNTLLKLIKEDIINNTTNFIENKVYHPIK